MKVILEATLSDIWATPEDLSQMTDDEIIELIKEDLSAFMEDGQFRVER